VSAVALLLALVLAAQPPAAVLHGAPETIVKRAFIPSDTSVHGEVRVLRRGGATCISTVLCSPSLARGVAAIRRQERASWPEGSAGREDSDRFVGALEAGTRAALERFAHRRRELDDRRQLLIEVLDGPEGAFVALYAIEADRREGRFIVREAEPVAVESVSHAYAARSMRLQAATAFHVEGEALEALLSGR
jgi:hypothetical protein